MCSELLAILHSPPLTRGLITQTRVALAQRLIGCEGARLVNLWPTPLQDVNSLNHLPTNTSWESWRGDLIDDLDRVAGGDVLLAYGVQRPTGANRQAFQDQLRWLETALLQREKKVWMFGGRPAHPSRWQRATSRLKPGEPMAEVAPQLLKKIDPRSLKL